jgi:hypothetical protein
MNEWEIEGAIAAYVVVYCGMRGVSPDTISKTYLPGIAGTFDLQRSECKTTFRKATNGKEIKLVVAGFDRRYNSKNPKANRLRLPYGLDMALKSKQIMRDKAMFTGPDAEILIERVFVCEIIGITFLLRKSEHMRTPGRAAAHPLIRRHVVFFDSEGRPIEYDRIGLQIAASVCINIVFAKADQSGYGRRTRHTRQSSSPEACAVTILERYMRITRDEYGCKIQDELYFLPRHGSLKVDKLHEVMQATARACGIKDHGKQMTSHSLRYGGATMLAAAGLPHYIIAIYGGWSPDSAALRIYTRPSHEMVDTVSRHMANMATKQSSLYFIQEQYVIAQAEVSAQGTMANSSQGIKKGKGSQIAKW